MKPNTFLRGRPPRCVPLRGRLPAGGRAVALAATLCLALSGCMTIGPDYARPAVPLPPAWRTNLPDAAEVTNTAWWDAFGDADLSELVHTALEANKDLLIASHRVEQFAARVEVSDAANYPQFGYQLGGERVKRSQEIPALIASGRDPNYTNFSIGINARWEIDLWGRVARANEAARAELLSSDEARRAVMLGVVTSVATSYVELLARDRQLALSRSVIANARNALALLDEKYRGGRATLLDLANARAAVEELEVQVPELELEIAKNENELSALLGRSPGPVKRRSLEQLAMPQVPSGIPSDVLSRRPDIVAAEQTLVAANARIGIAKAQYFPTISLTGALGLASDDLRWLFARTARTGDIGMGFAGALFSAGRIEGDIREAEASRRQMSETYLQTVQTALREVDDSLVSRAKAGEQLAAVERRLLALKDAVKFVRLRYEGGQATVFDVLDAERQLLSAQGQQTQVKRNQYTALVAIYKAMGGGWMLEQDKARAPKPSADVASTAAAASDIETPQ